MREEKEGGEKGREGGSEGGRVGEMAVGRERRRGGWGD